MLIACLLTALLAAAPQNLLDSGRRALESGDLVRAEQSFRHRANQCSEHAPGRLALRDATKP